eukprot:s5404_g3.t1
MERAISSDALRARSDECLRPTGLIVTQCSGIRVQQGHTGSSEAQTRSLVGTVRWSTAAPRDGHEPGAQRARKGFPALHTVRMPR